MVPMIPNVALIEGTVSTVENYPSQEGFCIVTLLITEAQEKEGMQFLGDGLTGKQTKILLSEILKKKLHLQSSILVKGEIRKITPILWRAFEETWKVPVGLKKSAKKSSRK